MGEYHKLDLNSLNYSDEIISYEETIKNAEQFKIIDVDLDGEEMSVVDEKIVCLTS